MAMKLSLVIQVAFIIIVVGCREDDDNVPLKACFEAPSTATRNQEINFDGSCSTSAEIYHWDFGDGSESTSQSPTHTFKGDGEYTIKLRVERNGIKDSITHQIAVHLTSDEINCKPAYILGAKLWPWRDALYDSVTFSYLNTDRLNDIKWYIDHRSTISTARLQFEYDKNGLLDKVHLLYLKAINPIEETLLSTFFIHRNSQGLPSRINWVHSELDSLRATNYFYDANNRLIEIVNRNIFEGTNHRTLYEYGPDGNTSKVFYISNLVPPNAISRINNSFDGTLLFYAASNELKVFFEYITQVEPNRNNSKSAHVYRAVYEGGMFYYGGGPLPNVLGHAVEYTNEINDKGLVLQRRITNMNIDIPTDINFRKIGYNCN